MAVQPVPEGEYKTARYSIRGLAREIIVSRRFAGSRSARRNLNRCFELSHFSTFERIRKLWLYLRYGASETALSLLDRSPEERMSELQWGDTISRNCW